MIRKDIERDGSEKHLIIDASVKGHPKLLLTPHEASQALAISLRKLWSMTALGEVPHVRLGRCVRYPVAELKDWIAEQNEGSHQGR